MIAAMQNHYNVVSLLKNKYGQEEPTPEEVVSYHSNMPDCVYSYVYVYDFNFTTYVHI